jgi:hypothetical protein
MASGKITLTVIRLNRTLPDLSLRIAYLLQLDYFLVLSHDYVGVVSLPWSHLVDKTVEHFHGVQDLFEFVGLGLRTCWHLDKDFEHYGISSE